MSLGSRAGAQNDITIGGDARAFAMGGAGIALAQDIGGARVNPASLVFETRKFDLRIPTIAIRSTNDLALSKVTNYFANGQLGNTGNINDLARTFVSTDSEFGLSGDTSIRYQNVEISGYAIAAGKLLPNDALRTWVNNGQQGILQEVAPGAQADLIAAGYANLPAVSVGFKLPQPATSKETIAVGVRAKLMRGYYAHYIANAPALDGETDVVAAPELGNNSYLTKRGFGADLGFLLKPQSTSRGTFSYGAIVSDAINPHIKFDTTDRNGLPSTLDLIKTTASVGTAYQYGRSFTFVTDLVDITQAMGKTQIRAGTEYYLPLTRLALRGGYSSATGFTYGAGFYGFNIALGKRQPLEIARTLNF
jgi:hypothetical protein